MYSKQQKHEHEICTNCTKSLLIHQGSPYLPRNLKKLIKAWWSGESGGTLKVKQQPKTAPTTPINDSLYDPSTHILYYDNAFSIPPAPSPYFLFKKQLLTLCAQIRCQTTFATIMMITLWLISKQDEAILESSSNPVPSPSSYSVGPRSDR